MGGMSIWHLLILLVILLLVFGPQRLEGIGSSLGKAIKGFKKGISDEEEEKSQKTKKDSTDDKA
jgi:sec-independent protein translocase protein TatA